jgi:hypothetical protein
MSTLEMAAMVCGGAEHWAVSVIVEGDTPDGFESDVGKAYEMTVASKAKINWAINQLLKGDSLRMRSYLEMDEQTKKKEQATRKELKDEAVKLEKEEKKKNAGKEVEAPRAIRDKAPPPPPPPAKAEAEEEPPEEMYEVGGPDDGTESDLEERRQRIRALDADKEARKLAESLGQRADSSSGRTRAPPQRLGVEAPEASSPKGRKRPLSNSREPGQASSREFPGPNAKRSSR